MNKIKAKINFDEFTPWEDSLDNVFRTMELEKKKKPWNYYQTIDPPSHRDKAKSLKIKQQTKRTMNRTSMNLSKINLNNSPTYINQQLQHSQSRRYAGPRITFYAQMNPKAYNGRSRSVLDPQQQKQQESFMTKKQLTGRMVRDESIKYLQIIDQKPIQEKVKRGTNATLPKPENLKKIGVVRARRNDQNHVYLRRLKMIYRKN